MRPVTAADRRRRVEVLRQRRVVLRQPRRRSSWGAAGARRCSCFGDLPVVPGARASTTSCAPPTRRSAIDFRRIWGAYIAAYGFNNVVPARGGDVIKLFLTRSSVPNSTYPAIGAAIFVEFGFDLSRWACWSSGFAFTQGVFPKPPDFAKLNAFDLSFFAQPPALRALPADGAGSSRALVGFARAEPARARVLGARAPGPDDHLRPPPLLPRGLDGPAAGLVLSLRGVLVPAGGLQHRRLGQERPARARRERGRRGRAVHAGRRRGAAGLPGARCSPGTAARRDRRRLLASASRSRSRRSASAVGFVALFFDLPLPVVPRGDRRGRGPSAPRRDARGYCRP